MKVYMLQDAVTGDFYRQQEPPHRRWVEQRLATVWFDKLPAAIIEDDLQPFYTIIIREYTLKPCE